MKTLITVILLLLFSTAGYSAITITDGKWVETFDAGCTAYQYPGAINCNGLSAGGPEGTIPPTNVTTISTDANHSNGGGGKGIRYWHRYGTNEISANIIAVLPTQKELWIRWYQRYQAEYAPDFINLAHSWYQKQLYVQQTNADKPTNIAVIPEWQGTNAYRADIQSRDWNTNPYHYAWSDQAASGDGNGGNGYGWRTVMGRDTSDGQWHCYEIHLKMDTTATCGWDIYPLPSPAGNYIENPNLDGIAQMWIDGNLMINEHHVNFSSGVAIMQQLGWDKILLGSNHSVLLNTSAEVYVDYDDFAIYTTTPPGRDAQNNPFIGPIGTEILAPRKSSRMRGNFRFQ